jgi:rRNA maturation endonuclease Nob1
MSSISDLINVELKEKDEFIKDRWEISYYCKDCKKIVETKRVNPRGYIFVCKECGGKNVAIWTKEWLKTAYKIKNS